MKSIIHNIFTLIIAIICILGGLFWCIQSNWQYEPLIIMLVAAVEIISFFAIPQVGNNADPSITNQTLSSPNTISDFNSITSNGNANNINNKVDIQINSNNEQKMNLVRESNSQPEDKSSAIEFKKNKISILFIDDDKNFNIVKILKDSGWKNTKMIVDVKTLDDSNIKNSEIIFVDINGVGKLLGLPNEGLDLALMIKQKYNNNKKVIIYSANNNNNAFHEAWDLADSRLAKNALPYQFQQLVEKFSANYYNN